jgi:hypothetical protein
MLARGVSRIRHPSVVFKGDGSILVIDLLPPGTQRYI